LTPRQAVLCRGVNPRFGVLGLFVLGCCGLEHLVNNLNVRMLFRNDLIGWMNDWLDGRFRGFSFVVGVFSIYLPEFQYYKLFWFIG